MVKRSEQLNGRRVFPILSVVTNNNDPEGRRRVKIADPLFGNLIESNWIRPIRVSQNQDNPLPQINQMVIVWFVDGDSEKGYYLPIINDANPSREKDDPVNDSAVRIEGNNTIRIDKNDSETVGGNQTVAIAGEQNINVDGNLIENIGGDIDQNVTGKIEVRSESTILIDADGTIIIKNDSGAFISLGGNGEVLIQDSQGRKIRLGGAFNSTWDLNGLPMAFINATSVTIAGKQIATVGAVDTRGDTIVNKGW
ncbi:baseplate assembly protein [Nostoc phage A1]|uniref:Baseplate assembly protein n=2 Tax=Caudoviricetes TaxID=2731619 RepID=A0ACD6B8W8_9CAUD|nr:baseplate assembly protein [Nostoc phage A1]